MSVELQLNLKPQTIGGSKPRMIGNPKLGKALEKGRHEGPYHNMSTKGMKDSPNGS